MIITISILKEADCFIARGRHEVACDEDNKSLALESDSFAFEERVRERLIGRGIQVLDRRANGIPTRVSRSCGPDYRTIDYRSHS